MRSATELTITGGTEPRKNPCKPQKTQLSHKAPNIIHERSSTLLVFNDFNTCGNIKEMPVTVPAYPNNCAKSIAKVYHSRTNQPRSPSEALAKEGERINSASSRPATATLISAISTISRSILESPTARIGFSPTN